MNTKYLLYLNFILLTACKSEIKIKQTDKCFEQFPKDRDFKEDIAANAWSEAKESYMIHTGDSWTFSTTVVFEKYNDLDYRLRTKHFNRDSFKTERKITKLDWEYICSTFDSLNFWCSNPEWDKISIDGHETIMIGKIDSHYHSIRIYDYPISEKDSVLSKYKKELLKTSLNLLRFGGFEGLKKPNFRIDTEGVDSTQIVAFYKSPFIQTSDLFINNVEIKSKQDVYYFKIGKKDTKKIELKSHATFVNGETYIYTVDVNQYFLNRIRERNFYE